MIQTTETKTDLFKNRNRTVARSFYRHLKSEGFSHEQIIELSTTLLDLVASDLQQRKAEIQAK